jgi:hypothetical protein
MSAIRNHDQICAMCDEYSVKQAAPEYAALGMGRCLARHDHGHLSVHVGWDCETCVSFRLDRSNLAKRRQYVATQRQKQEGNHEIT